MMSKNFVIAMLQKQWEKVPELRLMQLIVNFQSYKGQDCFYMTNEDFVYELAEYINSLKQ